MAVQHRTSARRSATAGEELRSAVQPGFSQRSVFPVRHLRKRCGVPGSIHGRKQPQLQPRGLRNYTSISAPYVHCCNGAPGNWRPDLFSQEFREVHRKTADLSYARRLIGYRIVACGHPVPSRVAVLPSRQTDREARLSDRVAAPAEPHRLPEPPAVPQLSPAPFCPALLCQ